LVGLDLDAEVLGDLCGELLALGGLVVPQSDLKWSAGDHIEKFTTAHVGTSLCESSSDLISDTSGSTCDDDDLPMHVEHLEDAVRQLWRRPPNALRSGTHLEGFRVEEGFDTSSENGSRLCKYGADEIFGIERRDL
jgi:hypothetical protein